jgi:hypothetical protein
MGWDIVEVHTRVLYAQVLRPFGGMPVYLHGNPKTGDDGQTSTGSFREPSPSLGYLSTHVEERKESHDVLGGWGASSVDMATTRISLAFNG